MVNDPLTALISAAAEKEAKSAEAYASDSNVEISAVAESDAIENGQLHNQALQAAEIETQRQFNEDRKENRALRKGYATKVYRYLVGYSVFVGALLLLSGFKICGFELGDSVLNFLVGSTAASAIGLVFSVTNGLFSGLEKGSK